MATNTTKLASLKIIGDGVDWSCQLIGPSFSPPGVQPGGTITEVACPDGVVVEDDSAPTAGSLTAEAFADTLDAGLTWALANAWSTGATIVYEYTYLADQDNTIAITYTGDAKVNSFELPGEKPGYAKHPLDLMLLTGTPARPAP